MPTFPSASIMEQEQQRALQAWQARVQNYPEACKWVKRLPRPWLLEKADGGVVAGQAKGVQAIFNEWKPLFTGPEGYRPPTNRPKPFWLRREGAGRNVLSPSCSTCEG